MELNTYAWHITTGLNILGIFETQSLIPKIKSREQVEFNIGGKPIIWFTIKDFEKMIRDVALKLSTGKIWKPKNAKDYRIISLGLYRFGLPTSQLIPYSKAISESGISNLLRNKNEKAAKNAGSNVFHWHGTFDKVSLNHPDLVFCYHNGTGWITANVKDIEDIMNDQAEEIEPFCKEILSR